MKIVGADVSVRPQKNPPKQEISGEFDNSLGWTGSSAPTGFLKLMRRGRCPHRPGKTHRFYGNLPQIRNCPMGRCGHRPLRIYRGEYGNSVKAFWKRRREESHHEEILRGIQGIYLPRQRHGHGHRRDHRDGLRQDHDEPCQRRFYAAHRLHHRRRRPVDAQHYAFSRRSR